MVAASDRQAVKFSLSPGNAHDAPEGRKLLRKMGSQTAKVPLLMDRAYEGDKNRQQAVEMGRRAVFILGNMTRSCIKSVTKWKDCFGD